METKAGLTALADKIGMSPEAADEVVTHTFDRALEDRKLEPSKEIAESMGRWLFDCIQNRDHAALNCLAESLRWIESADQGRPVREKEALEEFYVLQMRLNRQPTLAEFRRHLDTKNAREAYRNAHNKAEPTASQLSKYIENMGRSSLAWHPAFFKELAEKPPFSRLQRKKQ